MTRLRIRPPQYPRYRPALPQEELDAIEAGIPDGWYVSVLALARRGHFGARLYRDDNPNVVAVMTTNERTLADDVRWLVETYAREAAA